MPGRGGRANRPRPSPRNKRAEIVAVATEYFGENGYEDTKWAEVAEAVGLGPTALYHYFESKQQCLFEILGRSDRGGASEFVRLSDGEFARRSRPWSATASCATTARCCAPASSSPSRGWSATRATAPREEDARVRAFSLVKEYEKGWRDLLAAGMEEGAIPTVDPDLLARAVIGIYNSVWHWYRAEGG